MAADHRGHDHRHMTYARISADLPPESPGFLGGYVLQQVGHPATLTLSLWKDGADLEVVDDWSGPAAGTEPAVALLLTFDGPLAASMDALEDAGRVVNSTELLPGEDPRCCPGRTGPWRTG
jgi:hypothetical protein